MFTLKLEGWQLYIVSIFLFVKKINEKFKRDGPFLKKMNGKLGLGPPSPTWVRQ